ncbi:MAG: hypothetical protein LUC33_06330 [Prevotellaceae bacterium]|nr:hypothetical protein [Prevotellaceae bacterium]
MAGLGDIVSGAAGLATGIANIFTQRSLSQSRKDDLNKRIRQNQNWYNQRYNEDATQRADAQSMITKMQETLRQQNADAKGTAAVMGGTEESQAATKAANAQAIADTSSNIVQQADARKDSIEQQYLAQKNSLQDMQDQLKADQQQQMASALSNLGQSVGKGAASYGTNGGGVTKADIISALRE